MVLKHGCIYPETGLEHDSAVVIMETKGSVMTCSEQSSSGHTGNTWVG